MLGPNLICTGRRHEANHSGVADGTEAKRRGSNRGSGVLGAQVPWYRIGQSDMGLGG